MEQPNQIDDLKNSIENFEKKIHSAENLSNEFNALHLQELIKVMNNIDALIYVADIETNELLYLNRYGQNIFGEVVGQLCWKALQMGQKGPCSFCTNNKLIDSKGKATGVYVVEQINTLNNCWYDSHSRAIEWIDGRIVRLELSIDISDRKRDEKRLFKMLNQQALISKISNKFNTTDSFEQKINEVLSWIGQHTNVSRVLIIEYLPNETEISVQFEWCNPNFESKKRYLQHIDSDLFENLKKAVVKKGLVKINDINTESIEELTDLLIPFEVKAIVIAPIFVNQKLFGYVVMEDCVAKRLWNILEISLLKTIGSIFSIAYERQFIEQAVIKSESKLREVNAAKDKFFSIIAHDLKNPIYNLTSLSEFLLENFEAWEADKTKEFIKYIYQSSKQGFNLLENLLEWSRSQTGRIVVKPSDFNLFELVLECVELSKGTARNKSINLSMEVPKGCIVYADYNMIHTVVRNLISNALKFTNYGGDVMITAEEFDSYIKLTVDDNGVGISDEDIPKLFKIDINHSTAGTAEETGTGLGLILCKEFIEKNKGSIAVESAIGIGSKFIITLPKAGIH